MDVTYTYDTHGDKHFDHRQRKCSHWNLSKEIINPRLITYIKKQLYERQIIDYISNKKPKCPITFYICGNLNDIEETKNKDGYNDFTIQIGVKTYNIIGSKLSLEFHGYPDNVKKYGIGTTKSRIEPILVTGI